MKMWSPVGTSVRTFCIEAEVRSRRRQRRRWMAVSYGLKPSGTIIQYTFWQMAVRQNAPQATALSAPTWQWLECDPYRLPTAGDLPRQDL